MRPVDGSTARTEPFELPSAWIAISRTTGSSESETSFLVGSAWVGTPEYVWRTCALGAGAAKAEAVSCGEGSAIAATTSMARNDIRRDLPSCLLVVVVVPVALWPTAFTVFAEFSDWREASLGAQPPTRTFWATSSWSETGQRNSLRPTVKWRKGQAHSSGMATRPIRLTAPK